MADTKQRKTLVQLASETAVRDPAAHAKHQVEELDKTAKHSQQKRKNCNDQIESDTKEIEKLEEQIRMLKVRYDPLCAHLVEAKEQKKNLTETLQQCMGDQKKIMNETMGVIVGRRQEEHKMTKRMGSLQLETLRGYNLKPESTFYQNKSGLLGGSGTLNSTTGLRSLALTKKRNLASSVKSLPPLDNKVGGNMQRNQSSIL